MPNRLAGETSPYLLQHAGNPVDWYPWGPEALERAKREDRPILLSVGYSACHWCHVMERESFENDETAALMNREFVNIKVDREERPDIDAIYMAAVQALSGHGGWPMTVFLTPDGRPFYGGTYFPPEDRGGLPGFPRLLAAMVDAYRTKKGDVLLSTTEIAGRVQQMSAPRHSAELLTAELLDAAFASVQRHFDPEEGGVGTQPKFPQPLVIEFLLRHWARTGSAEALDMAELTLQKMARGGIYDQIGGGFARYSTDRQWLVPHFEKMLYDNALLARAYTHAFQATGSAAYRRVVEETLEYVRREMLDPAGGFYSSQDADSEGEEGRFYVWTPDEIDAVVGPSDGAVARAYYGVTEGGNFEHRNILHVGANAPETAAQLGISAHGLAAVLDRARPKLLEARARRIAPGLDDKVLVSWNAMMLEAFAEAGAALANEEWVAGARRNAAVLLENLFDGGRLLRTWKAGGSRLLAYLEDYALLGGALLTLYEATFETRWLAEAHRLADGMLDLFWDESAESFFDTGHDHEELFVRPRDVFDNPMPSGGSAAAMLLLRLAVFTGDASYQRTAVAALRSVRDLLADSGTGLANWLAALDFYLSTPKEIVVIGDRSDTRTAALLREAYGRYLPNSVVAGAEGPTEPAPTPLLEGRGLAAGAPAAYVCEKYECRLPVSDPKALAEQLAV